MNDLATNPDAMAGVIGMGMILVSAFIGLLLYVAVAIGLWKIFVKAGEEGWKAIIPIYNTIILIKIAERPSWFMWAFIGAIVFSFIPIIGMIGGLAALVLSIILNLELAKRFNKSQGFAVGMILLPFIFYILLGFDENTKYTSIPTQSNENIM